MSIHILENVDKKHNESWSECRDWMNIPSPSRLVLCGAPSSGKTNTILNLLLKAEPRYDKIYLMHPMLTANDSDDEQDPGDDECKVPEYKNIDYEPLTELPAPSFFKKNKDKTILIIDDVELKSLDKFQKKRLNKIISYSSSHNRMTTVISTQDSFSQCPPCVFRFSNFIVLWRYNDLLYLQMLLKRAGMSKSTAEKVIQEMQNYGLHDCLCIDSTFNSPCKFRKNFYNKIEF